MIGRWLPNVGLSDHVPVEWTFALPGVIGRSMDVPFHFNKEYLSDPKFCKGVKTTWQIGRVGREDPYARWDAAIRAVVSFAKDWDKQIRGMRKLPSDNLTACWEILKRIVDESPADSCMSTLLI